MILLPGLRSQSLTGLSQMPMPEVLMMMLSSASLGRTFVSPVTTAVPASSSASSTDFTMRFRSSMGKPSGMTTPFVRAIGFAPIMARSFTVPDMDSLPMSPPGKKMGLMT